MFDSSTLPAHTLLQSPIESAARQLIQESIPTREATSRLLFMIQQCFASAAIAATRG